MNYLRPKADLFQWPCGHYSDADTQIAVIRRGSVCGAAGN